MQHEIIRKEKMAVIAKATIEQLNKIKTSVLRGELSEIDAEIQSQIVLESFQLQAESAESACA